MNVILIRHAVAEDRAEFARTGKPDALRPLTKHGRKKFKKAVKGLKKAAPRLGVIATSPYERARSTCDIVAKAYKSAPVSTVAALAHGGNARQAMTWVAGRRAADTVALVGHEPDLGRLAAVMVGAPRPPVVFKKGGAALIVFDGKVAAGEGKLAWLLTPRLMKRLG